MTPRPAIGGSGADIAYLERSRTMSYAKNGFETGGHLLPAMTAVGIFVAVSLLMVLFTGLPH
jgi:hypothetical protein